MPRKPSQPGARSVVPFDKQPASAQEAGDWLARHTRMDLSMVASLVRYADHMDYEDETGEPQVLGADEFLSLSRLALLDLFMLKMGEDEKVKLLMGGEHPADRDPGRLEVAREHPAYRAICDDLLRVARSMKKSRGIEEWAKELEDMASREVAATGLFAPSSRERLHALDEFLARRSAKKGREEGGRQFRLPPEFVELIGEAARVLRDRGQAVDAEVEEISASEINVPQIPEKASS